MTQEEKELLEEARMHAFLLAEVRFELDALEGDGLRSPQMTGLPHHGGYAQGTERRLIRAEALLRVEREHEEWLEAHREALEPVLKDIGRRSPRMRLFSELYYLQGLERGEAARLAGITARQSRRVSDAAKSA